MNVGKEVAILHGMSIRELREKHEQVFGEPTRSGHKQYLVRRIAWRIQSLAEGDLSERERRRAMQLARDQDIRTTMPRGHAVLVPNDVAPAEASVHWAARIGAAAVGDGSAWRQEALGAFGSCQWMPHLTSSQAVTRKSPTVDDGSTATSTRMGKWEIPAQRNPKPEHKELSALSPGFAVPWFSWFCFRMDKGAFAR